MHFDHRFSEATVSYFLLPVRYVLSLKVLVLDFNRLYVFPHHTIEVWISIKSSLINNLFAVNYNCKIEILCEFNIRYDVYSSSFGSGFSRNVVVLNFAIGSIQFF